MPAYSPLFYPPDMTQTMNVLRPQKAITDYRIRMEEKSRIDDLAQQKMNIPRDIMSLFLGQETTSAEAPEGPSSARQALEASILRRGKESQGALSSLLAKRGIYGGGPSAAAAAKLQAEIESNVALSSAQFAESEATRQSQERTARQQAFTSLLSNITGQLGAM